MSNHQAADLLREIRRPQLNTVLLGHLSEVNNTDALALQAAREVLDGAEVWLGVAPQHHATRWHRLQPRASARDGAQTRVDLAADKDDTKDSGPQTRSNVERPERQVVDGAGPEKRLAVMRQLRLFGAEEDPPPAGRPADEKEHATVSTLAPGSRGENE